MSDNIHTQLEKLKTELSKLEPAVIHLQKADEAVKEIQSIVVKLIPLIDELRQENNKLTASNSKLIEKIDKVDFPSRLEKVDATVSSINQGLQNTQSRLGDLERNIKDDNISKTKEIVSSVDQVNNLTKQLSESIFQSINQKFESQRKANKQIKVLIFIALGFLVVLLALQIITKL
jgi:hypothetical protein